MKALLNNPWMVGALCIAAVITVYLRLFDTKSSPSDRPPIAQPEVIVSPVELLPEAVPVVGLSDNSSGSKAPIIGKWIDTIARDPFQRMREEELVSSEGLVPDDESPQSIRPDQSLHLHAIFVNGSNRIAVINNTFVKVGDHVAGFRVSQINPDGVLLQGTTAKQWLEFGGAQNQEQVS